MPHRATRRAHHPGLFTLLGGGLLALGLMLPGVASAASAAPQPAPAGQPLIAVVTSGESIAPASQAAAVTPDAYTGKSVWARIDYYSLLGADICNFKVTKYFEYNGTRVNNIEVTALGVVNSGEGLAGWGYDGIIASSDGYRTWGGHTDGDHNSVRQGKFTQTVKGIKLNEKDPYISITVYADGSYSHTCTP